MALISDGTGTYRLDADGKKHYATTTELSIGGEPVYRFDPATGILEIPMSDADIQILTDAFGGLPIEEIVLPAPPDGEDLISMTSRKADLGQEKTARA